jgi:hypothetical protein
MIERCGGILLLSFYNYIYMNLISRGFIGEVDKMLLIDYVQIK